MRSGFRFNVGSTGGGGILSKIVGSIFFVVVGGAGVLFLGLMSREFGKNARTWFWQSTPCEILAISIVEDRDTHRNDAYRLEVSFRYAFNGRDHTAQHSSKFSNYSDAAQVLHKYPAEGQATCYVNSSAPDQAVLKRGDLWMLPFMAIPLVFVLVGFGGVYFTWRRRDRAASPAPKPISERANPARGGLVLVLFFSVFLGMGSLFLWMMFIRPALQIWDARDWREAPCRVISSEVRTHSDSDGSTYSVAILYEYEVNGQVYKSDRYKFVTGSSSGRAAKAAIVANHPPGKQTTCYFNPSDPSQAVIERGFTPDLWFAAIPLVFVAFGLGGMVFGVRTWLNKASGESGSSLLKPTVIGKAAQVMPVPSATPEGPRRLKPTVPPWGRLLVSILVAAFWNGIVSVFLVQIVRAFERGRPEWFLTIFMIPFLLIGLGLIAWVGYSGLALFNPRPTVQLTPGELRLGEPFEVTWEFSGRLGTLERVTLELEGREEATYRRGTSTTTDKSVFARIQIADAATLHEMLRGCAKASVPSGTMHSFKAPNNKIVWQLRIHGRVPRWPDVREEFPVTVHPATTKPGALT